MDLTINTGDSADSQQLNETEWVRTLLEGGNAQPGQRHRPRRPPTIPVCAAAGAAGVDRRRRRAGELHRRPGLRRLPGGRRAAVLRPGRSRPARSRPGPQYPGLLDRAQQPFDAAGPRRPLLRRVRQPRRPRPGQRGRERAATRTVATGCVKPMSPLGRRTTRSRGALGALDPATLSDLLSSDPTRSRLVPPDPNRQYVSKAQYKDVFEGGTQADGHGFGLVDPAEEQASGGAAGYYAWSPLPGLPLHRARHGLGGRRDRAVGRRQHRRPAVSVARGPARGGDRRRPARRAVQPPRDPEPDRRRPRRDGAALRRATDAHGHDANPGCDLDPRELGADPPRRRHGDAAAPVPARDRLGRGPLARQRDRAARQSGRAAGSGASGSPPRPTGRSRPACSRSSTTRTARSRSSARSSTTPATRPRRPPAPTRRRWTRRPRLDRPHARLQRHPDGRPRGRGRSRRPQRRAAGRRPARDGDGGGCSNAIGGTPGDGHARRDGGRRRDPRPGAATTGSAGTAASDCVRGGRGDDGVKGDEGRRHRPRRLGPRPRGRRRRRGRAAPAAPGATTSSRPTASPRPVALRRAAATSRSSTRPTPRRTARR